MQEGSGWAKIPDKTLASFVFSVKGYNQNPFPDQMTPQLSQVSIRSGVILIMVYVLEVGL